jgi:hypothetical protein
MRGGVGSKPGTFLGAFIMAEVCIGLVLVGTGAYIQDACVGLIIALAAILDLRLSGKAAQNEALLDHENLGLQDFIQPTPRPGEVSDFCLRICS